jgi:hypothetical protein
MDGAGQEPEKLQAIQLGGQTFIQLNYFFVQLVDEFAQTCLLFRDHEVLVLFSLLTAFIF